MVRIKEYKELCKKVRIARQDVKIARKNITHVYGMADSKYMTGCICAATSVASDDEFLMGSFKEGLRFIRFCSDFSEYEVCKCKSCYFWRQNKDYIDTCERLDEARRLRRRFFFRELFKAESKN
ncbi:MAG: hypothetical protein K5912_02245 [Alphaproteobacteria bacterium]|nr:hypothetical protein [Alphaproteobacteria bacterium]